MKIKNINDLTLDECQEYLDENPNGELAQEVVQRLEYLQDIKNRELQQEHVRRINDFNIEFNRYYATQRYDGAFAICLKYICEAENKTEIIEKANIVIPKLKSNIQIPSSISISYDWLIDQLVLNGYNNMKYDGTMIKWKSSTIKLSNNNNTTKITSKCRINIFFRILIFIAFGFITGLIIGLSYELGYGSYEEDLILALGVSVAIAFFIIWISIYTQTLVQHKKLLRKISQITIDYFSK